MIKTKIIHILITKIIPIVILSFGFFLLLAMFGNAIPRKIHPRNSQAHTINLGETSGNWEMLWKKSDIYFEGQPVTADDTFCYKTIRREIRLFSNSKVFLACLDIHSGIEKWAGKAMAGVQIASDHDQIYTGVGIKGFIAYNAENGEEMWRQSVKGRNLADIVAYGGFVKARVGGATGVYHVFDAATGAIQDNNDVRSMSYYSFASDGQRQFLKPSRYRILSPSYWEESFKGQIRFRPILNDNRVFVRTNYVVGPIYALDAVTGHTLWGKEDVVSNVAVSNSTAFYVTIDGEVMAVDAQTGETVGRLKFNAEELVDIDTSDNTHYYVEAVDDMMFVYFGDTWQLFAFRFSQE